MILRSDTTVSDSLGTPLPGVYITVRDSDGELASTFSDDQGTPKSNPFQSGPGGAFAYYASAGSYSEEYRLTLGGQPRQVVSVVIDATITDSDLASTATGKGAALVNFKRGADTNLTPATVATLQEGRPLQLMECVGATLTDRFDSARAYLEANGRGGTILLPPGDLQMRIDLAGWNAGFNRQIVVAGDGPRSTRILPRASGEIPIDMSGCNEASIRDLSVLAAAYAVPCGLYVARTQASQNANNNKFTNLRIEGNFTNHAVVSAGAESSLWLNCRFVPTAGAYSGFWTGPDPTLSGVTAPSGTAYAGPNTDNRMIACETYAPYANARGITISQSGGWMFDKFAFIMGSVPNTQMVRIQDANAGVINGPLMFRDCHWEAFGTGNTGIYVAGAGTIYVYGLTVDGGYVVSDDNFTFLDFDRDQNLGTGGAYLLDSVLTAPAIAPGLTGGLPIYCWGMNNSRVFWRARSGGARVVCFALFANGTIEADETALASLVNAQVTRSSPDMPTAGTVARGERVARSYHGGPLAAGDVQEWIAYASGTLGALGGVTASVTNGSRNVVFSTAAGLEVGQRLTIGGNDYILAVLDGVNGKLSVPYIAATAGAAAVAFTFTGFSTNGAVNLGRAGEVTDLAGGAALADVIAKVNEMLASDRAAGQRA